MDGGLGDGLMDWERKRDIDTDREKVMASSKVVKLLN